MQKRLRASRRAKEAGTLTTVPGKAAEAFVPSNKLPMPPYKAQGAQRPVRMVVNVIPLNDSKAKCQGPAVLLK